MGASKRAAEKYVQSLAQRSKTHFVTVRFGNVLGSNGSVIPTFKEQIAKGGPVTVTHRDVTRYFMTIPEASQLVLQAGSMGRGGEIFLLDMGEPVKILELAEELIRLSGLKPYEDIDILFTGLRPGEKLFEELLLAGEGVVGTAHEKICVAQSEIHDAEVLYRQLEDLFSAAKLMNLPQVIEFLQKIVPEYESQNHLRISHPDSSEVKGAKVISFANRFTL
jgi:FlaA1/EpsC-like NDP-sugar epimerase